MPRAHEHRTVMVPARRDAMRALRRQVATVLGAYLALLCGAAFVEARVERATVAALVGLSVVGGAAVLARLARTLGASAAGDDALLAPKLPLMGGVYLATPLLWLASTQAAAADPLDAALGVLPLALFGASLLGAVRASRGEAARRWPAYAAVTGVWVALGTAPVLVVRPIAGVGVVVASTLFAVIHPVALGMSGRERRVEGPALRRALPLLVLHTALVALAPVAAERAPDVVAVSWAAVSSVQPPVGIAHCVALFATLGYVATELRGRGVDESVSGTPSLDRRVVGIAVVVVALRLLGGETLDARAAASAIATCVVLTTAAALGARLYECQRRYARARSERRGVRTVVVARRRRAA